MSESKNDLDYLIIGGGLAGCLCALEALSRGLKVAVLDDGNPHSSSRAASAVLHPHKLRAGKRADREEALFDQAYSWYRAHLPKALQAQRLWHFFEAEESQDSEWQRIDQAFRLNINLLHQQVQGNKAFLFLAKTRFAYSSDEENCPWVSRHFPFDSLAKKDGLWSLGNLRARKVIFCDGTEISKNPWFSFVPMKPARGDALILELPKLHRNYFFDYLEKEKLGDQEHLPAFHRRVFFLPEDEKGVFWRLGASYTWDPLYGPITPETRRWLLAAFDRMFPNFAPCFVLREELWGVRPIARDREAVAGVHPDDDTLCVVNGLGARGVLCGPALATAFFDFQQGKAALPEQWSLGRFIKREQKRKGRTGAGTAPIRV